MCFCDYMITTPAEYIGNVHYNLQDTDSEWRQIACSLLRPDKYLSTHIVSFFLTLISKEVEISSFLLPVLIIILLIVLKGIILESVSKFGDA